MMTDPAPQGERDLATMLAALTIEVRPGIFTVVTGAADIPSDQVLAMIREAEGPTLVLEVETARSYGLPVAFEAAWLTVQLHSSLEAVGLTAALAQALAQEGIPCNVLAGFYHDHLLVPADRATEAVNALNRIPPTSSDL